MSEWKDICHLDLKRLLGGVRDENSKELLGSLMACMICLCLDLVLINLFKQLT